MKVYIQFYIYLVFTIASIYDNVIAMNIHENIHEYHQQLNLHYNNNLKNRELIGPPRTSLLSRSHAIEKTKRLLQDTKAGLTTHSNKSYKLKWNDLSDLSDQEYHDFLRSRPIIHSHLHKGSSKYKTHMTFENTMETLVNENNLPKNVNWATDYDGKYMSPIKNQGTCGSCWAFAAVTVVESRYAIEHNVTAPRLSVEQVLSCSGSLVSVPGKPSNFSITSTAKGCEGGMPYLGFQYMATLNPHGIACAASFPYSMSSDPSDYKHAQERCDASDITTDNIAVSWEAGVTDYVDIQPGDDMALLAAVAEGPVSANIDSSGDGFRHYGGGIYDGHDCLSDGMEVDHAVVIVGYGEDEVTGEKYWVIRNTWGTMWGENGEMRITRDFDVHKSKFGPCNLYLLASYPVNLQNPLSEDNTNKQCLDYTQSFSAENGKSDEAQQLSTMSLIFGDSNGHTPALEWVMLTLSSIISITIAISWITYSEAKSRQQLAASTNLYSDLYKNWIVPNKDQLRDMLKEKEAKRKAKIQESI